MQFPGPACPRRQSSLLSTPQEELAEHGDIVIVRGPDTYMDLPNKTFRMLRFGHAHPKRARRGVLCRDGGGGLAGW